jgi:hypothetical protein
LSPRDRFLARLAVKLTTEPWALSPGDVAGAQEHGFDDGLLEAAFGVIAMFNYFTRVADATGIEFDYPTPLPAFEPDICQVAAPRPASTTAPQPASAHQSTTDAARQASGPAGRPLVQHPRLQAAWNAWRTYELETDQPLSRRQRGVIAATAAEESADWQAVQFLTSEYAVDPSPPAPGDALLVAFARKLSRQPWTMRPEDLDQLRAAGFSELAVLHAISLTAHQNADSRLATGLSAMRNRI